MSLLVFYRWPHEVSFNEGPPALRAVCEAAVRGRGYIVLQAVSHASDLWRPMLRLLCLRKQGWMRALALVSPTAPYFADSKTGFPQRSWVASPGVIATYLPLQMTSAC